MNFLSEEDLIELTGATQKGKQADILAKAGIHFIIRMDGTIKTIEHWVNNPNIPKLNISDESPDFSALG